MPSPQPCRILFVFAWLVVGGEETEVRLLAQTLDPKRYQIDVVACFRKPNMPEQSHEQLAALGVTVDKTPYNLSFEDTVDYLARKIPAYDIVVACQAVPDVYPALARLAHRPPLIEHGGLVEEALRGPKHFTTRYVGVCASICEAAASRMAERPHHVLEIPSMVDLREFSLPQHDAVRQAVRQAWRMGDEDFVIGWVGRLDRKKRVEDFLQAAALLHHEQPQTRFVVIGGPDAFMPEYADELQALAATLEIDRVCNFLGDRADVPQLLHGLDSFVWLSKGEGMPHVIAEAGAVGLPVVATCDNGTAEQITHRVHGLFVPHEAPAEVAAALQMLITDSHLRYRLGRNLQEKVQREYCAERVAQQWAALFDELHQPAAVKAPPTPAVQPAQELSLLWPWAVPGAAVSQSSKFAS
jgi:glycosyltransferase involved in cell wall biosynthesis